MFKLSVQVGVGAEVKEEGADSNILVGVVRVQVRVRVRSGPILHSPTQDGVLDVGANLMRANSAQRADASAMAAELSVTISECAIANPRTLNLLMQTAIVKKKLNFSYQQSGQVKTVKLGPQTFG